MTDEGKRGVPVHAVIAALIAGKACEAQKGNEDVSDGSVVVSILRKSRTVCTCVRNGMAWDEVGDNMRLQMSVPSLVKLCKARGIKPADFKVGDGPRFNFHRNGKNLLDGEGVHVAVVSKDALAVMISKVVSDRIGFPVIVTVNDLPQLSKALDEAV